MPHCNVVESNECVAPAGIATGMGYAELPGVRSLPTCPYCGEHVCRACSVPGKNGRRLCSTHRPDEIEKFLKS